jgi:hypothetical protein
MDYLQPFRGCSGVEVDLGDKHFGGKMARALQTLQVHMEREAFLNAVPVVAIVMVL